METQTRDTQPKQKSERAHVSMLTESSADMSSDFQSFKFQQWKYLKRMRSQKTPLIVRHADVKTVLSTEVQIKGGLKLPFCKYQLSPIPASQTCLLNPF